MTTEAEAALLFRGTVANSEVKYVRVPIHDGKIGVHVGWKTIASSATITLDLTSVPGVSVDEAGAAWQWKDSGLSFTGPSGASINALSINIENVRQSDARLKIVGAAASVFEIWDGLAPSEDE
jgi:hypothetical protein